MGFLSKNPDSHTHSFSFITQSAISAAHICMDIGQPQEHGQSTRSHCPQEIASPFPGSHQLSIAPKLRWRGGDECELRSQWFLFHVLVVKVKPHKV